MRASLPVLADQGLYWRQQQAGTFRFVFLRRCPIACLHGSWRSAMCAKKQERDASHPLDHGAGSSL